MRKLFRMKYEPCEGRCYAPAEVLGVAGLGLDAVGAASLLDRLTEIHDRACGDEGIAYSLDVDEDNGVFVAGFWHHGRLDLFSDRRAAGAIEKLVDAAMAYYGSEGYARLVANGLAGADKARCEHGRDADLRSFMIEHSGLSGNERAELEFRLACRGMADCIASK